MKKRYKIPLKKSKSDFSRKAVKVHKKNNLNPMRGGIRG